MTCTNIAPGTRVGIVTICDFNNYGNRLQNYATQEVLKSLGCVTETIVNTPWPETPTPEPRASFREVATMLARLPWEKVRELAKARRLSGCRQFTSRHIVETPFIVVAGDVPEGLADRYDVLVTGSDQVWNPTWGHGAALDFLTFAPKAKRVAFAASFGLDRLPSDRAADYAAALADMASISVRERGGADLVRALTGRDVPVLIDPTLMLSARHWRSLSAPARATRSGRLVTYFLGEPKPEQRAWISAVSRSHRLRVVELASRRDPLHYAASPEKFLGLLASASLVATDSFHGAAFSILFERPFVVFEREGPVADIGSRLDNLLDTFGLRDRTWERMRVASDPLVADFSGAAATLEAERLRALNYLREAVARATDL